MSPLTQNRKDIADGKTVLVKLSAPGCGPCKVYANTFHAFNPAHVIKASLCISEDDVYEWMKTVTKAQSVPVTMLFRDGKKVAEKTGALTGPELINLLEEDL